MDQPTWKTMELKRLREAYENAKRNYYGKQYVERREKEEQGEGTMTQCVAMAMKPYYSTNPLAASFALRNGYQRGQCSRKAKIGSLCTQHEKIRLHQEFLKAREEREKDK